MTLQNTTNETDLSGFLCLASCSRLRRLVNHTSSSITYSFALPSSHHHPHSHIIMSTEPVSWKDSNLALIGSDLDHKIKLAAAEHEQQWQALHDAMQHKDQVTLLVFRMEDFHVVPWPTAKYGQFHVGDSYLIFHAQPTKLEDGSDGDLICNLHIWIGQDSSADEYGTAAYKMVEADEIVGGAAVQHREVQGHESALFHSYFTKLQYLQGGIASGFHHVEATKEEPHLYRIKGTMHKGCSLTQVDVKKSCLCEGDSYILYAGETQVWLWIGKDSNPEERNKASQLAESMCVDGNVTVLDQANGNDTDDEAFWNYLGTDGHIKTLEEEEEDGEGDETVLEFTPTLYRLVVGQAADAVASGEPIKIGFGRATPRIPKSTLVDSDVFLLDAGWEIYVWVGAKASRDERLASMDQAHQYTQANGRTLHLPLTFVKEGNETTNFSDFFYDKQ